MKWQVFTTISKYRKSLRIGAAILVVVVKLSIDLSSGGGFVKTAADIRQLFELTVEAFTPASVVDSTVVIDPEVSK